MKIAGFIVRILLGLMFAFASISFFLHLMPEPVLTGNTKIFMEGVAASVYLMPTVKIFELLCSIAFLSGRFVALAAVVIFPVLLNILFYHIFLDPSGIGMAAVLLLMNLFLLYTNREKFKAVLTSK